MLHAPCLPAIQDWNQSPNPETLKPSGGFSRRRRSESGREGWREERERRMKVDIRGGFGKHFPEEC